MIQEAMIYALRTFKRRSDGEKFWVADCLTLVDQNTPNARGYDQVSVFITEEQYNKLLKDFTPLTPVDLLVSLSGKRANYSLAS